MNLIAFIVVACDISGRPCQEYSNLVDLPLITCQMVSPQLVASFMQAHPGKWPKKWRCEWPGYNQKV